MTSSHPDVHVSVYWVVTGRQAQEEICALAERMMKRRPVQYPFQCAIRAQPEIDS